MIDEEDFLDDMINALKYNKCDFKIVDLDVTIKKKTKEFICLNDDGEATIILTAEEMNVSGEDFRKYSRCKNLKLHIVLLGTKDDDMKEISLLDKSDFEDIEKTLFHDFRSFLEFNKVDTRGKMLKLMYDGYEIMKEVNGIKNEYRLVLDEPDDYFETMFL